ncbi:hypothetical protein D3C72_2350830 [compost metagenome]
MFRAITQLFQGSGAISVHDNIGVFQQMFKGMAIVGVGQVQSCTAFAEHHLMLNSGFVPAVGIDTQYVRP